MVLFLILLTVFVLGLCLTKKDSRKIFLAVFFGILWLPIGVILALAKNYK